MKIYSFTLEKLFSLRISLGLFLVGLTCSVQAVDVKFTATFQAPTCQVSAPASLDFGTVISREIKQGDSLANPLPLDVTLSNCAGFVGTALKPGVKVTGDGGTTTGGYLFFKSSDTQSVNYGIRITTSDSVVVQNNSFLPAPLSYSDFDGGSAIIPLKAALSCGNKCNDAATKAGALMALVTFNFAYQ